MKSNSDGSSPFSQAQEDVIDACLRFIGPFQWRGACYSFAEAASHAECTLDITTTDYAEVRVQVPDRIIGLFRKLRATMWVPEHGVWMHANVVITNRPHTVSLTFEPFDRYDWIVEPSDDNLVVDLLHYIRPWFCVPDWHPVRRLYWDSKWTTMFRTLVGQGYQPSPYILPPSPGPRWSSGSVASPMGQASEMGPATAADLDDAWRQVQVNLAIDDVLHATQEREKRREVHQLELDYAGQEYLPGSFEVLEQQRREAAESDQARHLHTPNWFIAEHEKDRQPRLWPVCLPWQWLVPDDDAPIYWRRFWLLERGGHPELAAREMFELTRLLDTRYSPLKLFARHPAEPTQWPLVRHFPWDERWWSLREGFWHFKQARFPSWALVCDAGLCASDAQWWYTAEGETRFGHDQLPIRHWRPVDLDCLFYYFPAFHQSTLDADSSEWVYSTDWAKIAACSAIPPPEDEWYRERARLAGWEDEPAEDDDTSAGPEPSDLCESESPENESAESCSPETESDDRADSYTVRVDDPFVFADEPLGVPASNYYSSFDTIEFCTGDINQPGTDDNRINSSVVHRGTIPGLISADDNDEPNGTAPSRGDEESPHAAGARQTANLACGCHDWQLCEECGKPKSAESEADAQGCGDADNDWDAAGQDSQPAIFEHSNWRPYSAPSYCVPSYFGEWHTGINKSVNPSPLGFA